LVIIYLSRIFCVNWHFIILLECERCIEGLICVHTHSFATVLLLDMCIHLHSFVISIFVNIFISMHNWFSVVYMHFYLQVYIV
jgi:hypothetical protein